MHSVYIHLNYFNKLPQKNEDDNQGSRAAESNSNRNVFFSFSNSCVRSEKTKQTQ